MKVLFYLLENIQTFLAISVKQEFFSELKLFVLFGSVINLVIKVSK
jgi:hypothetical protein